MKESWLKKINRIKKIKVKAKAKETTKISNGNKKLLHLMMMNMMKKMM